MSLCRVGLVVAALGCALPARAQVWRTLDVSRARIDTAPLAVRVEYTQGEFQTRRATDSQLVYDFHLRYDASRTLPIVAFDSAARRISLGTHLPAEPAPPAEGRRRGAAELELGPQTPLDLMVRLSLSSGDLQLGGLNLRRLAVETSAGEVKVRFDSANATPMQSVSLDVNAATLEASGLANARAVRVRIAALAASADVDFGGEWTSDLNLDIDVTLGTVTVRVPSSVGVQLESRRVLSNIDARGLTAAGDVHTSDNWGTARHKLHIRANATLGQIEIVRDGR